LLGWAVATALVCWVVHHVYALDVDEAHPRAIVASVWSGGQLVARRVLRPGETDPALDAAVASHSDAARATRATRVDEAIVAEGPVLSLSEATIAVSFVSGRDGVSATLGDRTAYLTPDDLLARQAYDKGFTVEGLQLTTGVDVPLALALLAEQLGTTARELADHGRLHRIRTVRTVPGSTPGSTATAAAATPGKPADPARVTAETLTADDVRGATVAAGRYLARGVDADGRFRYLVDAPSNRTLPGYDWPRHAGATYFLAQAAALSHDPQVAWAALRAASLLRDHAMVPCGENRCIGDSPIVDVGSTALAVLAFVEIARTKLDPGYALVVPGLTAFLRAQQRPDGELMHLFDRDAGHPIDTQLLYYSGEAAFAMARAHGLVGDDRDLVAAKAVLAHLVGDGWSFFGSRYYWGEEHWTCQAMDELWERAPDAVEQRALRFCLDWEAFNRKLQYGEGETSFDADGAYGFGPLLTPRLTPTGSRGEAGMATLEAARRAGVPAAELAPLENQMRRSLALLVRQQIRVDVPGTGRAHLLANPQAIDGAMPGSEVDWQLRIDYTQHAGSAMVRWLGLVGQ
jgi:hypothetical protein